MQHLKLIKNKIFVCILFFLSIPLFTLHAQDKILKTDNAIIEAKVVEISASEIKYKKFSNLNGPTYTISKTDIQMIVYENGEKEMFNAESKQIGNKPPETLKKSPIQCIEELWGVKLENAVENGGGIKIVKLEANSIFKPQAPLGRLYIYNVQNGKKSVRVRNTDELATVLFDAYKKGISKINLTSATKRMGKLSFYTYDHLGIDISGLSKCQGADSTIKKLSIDESKNAGRTVADIYHKPDNWIMQGFCAGMLFGVAGVGLMGFIAALTPSKNRLPKPPPNVDANAWSSGYKSKIKKKLLLTGLTGSVLGAALVIGAFSSVN